MRYKEEISFLEKVEDKKDAEINKREKLTDKDIEEIREQYSDIPQNYLDYLKEIGYGTIRECQFMVYEGLENIEDILGYEVEELEDKKFLVFGDNYSGDFSGFLIEEEWKVAEFWHDCEELKICKQSFHEYIREQMLMDENGEDTRE